MVFGPGSKDHKSINSILPEGLLSNLEYVFANIWVSPPKSNNYETCRLQMKNDNRVLSLLPPPPKLGSDLSMQR